MITDRDTANRTAPGPRVEAPPDDGAIGASATGASATGTGATGTDSGAPMPRDALVIAGPTASRKSALALALARALDGEIVNADSMQVYADLRILTARPDADDEAAVPHHLYGILPATDPCSAARWARLARDAIADIRHRGRLPILVGGTGLYLRALTRGLIDLPEIPDAVRQAARQALRDHGDGAFHAALAARDPAMAARLEPGDGRRSLRAWEVLEATGRSLADWQADGTRDALGPLPAVILTPPRVDLYAACDARFTAMIDAGALDEVARLAGLDRDLPAMKAVGVPELGRFLDHGWTLDRAVAAAQQATRRYAKRQMTWFRHQAARDLTVIQRVKEQLSDEMIRRLIRKVRKTVLT